MNITTAIEAATAALELAQQALESSIRWSAVIRAAQAAGRDNVTLEDIDVAAGDSDKARAELVAALDKARVDGR